MTLWAVIVAAFVAFAGTNIDAALVLVVYFANAAQSMDGFSKKHIWIGQTLGFTIIMAISLCGALAGSLLPPHYMGVLGFVPLCIGLWRMRLWCPPKQPSEPDSPSFETLSEEDPEDPETPTLQDKDPKQKPNKCLNMLSSVFSLHTLKVAVVALGNGGDNVATYVPLLIKYTPTEILLTTAIFYLLLFLWIFVASAFVSFQKVAEFIERYGKFIVPVALVLIGLYILWSGDVIKLVCAKCG